jgi:hypothetical protein
MDSITARGHNGTVTFDGVFITITRKGFLARVSVGKGEKRIPLASVTAVQWKPPGALVNGYIQFTLSGGNERRSQFGRATTDAGMDENSVVVVKSQRAEFEALRAAVDEAIVARLTAPTSAPAAPTALEQLRQLGELRDAGVVTEAEFEAKKAQLLGLPATD